MNFKKIIRVIFTIPLISLSHAKSLNTVTLCSANEIDIASCQIAESKKRIVSICHDEKKNKTEYRFGKRNKVELIQSFDASHKLLRWKDLGTGSTYFGFKNNQTFYSLSIPQEKNEAKAFLEAFTNDGHSKFQKSCTTNSFGETAKKLITIQDVSDRKVRDSGFDFPAMFYKK